MQRFVWLLLTSAMVAGMIKLDVEASAQGRSLEPDKMRAGPWTAWIELTPMHTWARAIPYRQVVYRQGPQDRTPVQLCEKTSAGRAHIALRQDGLLFVQMIGGPPALYFPDTVQPVILDLPRPKHWNHPFLRPYNHIGSNNGHVSWQGDVLFYGRHAHSSVYLIGYVRVDTRGKRITENRVCLEASAEFSPDAGDDEIAGAAKIDYTKKPFRAGDYIFWANSVRLDTGSETPTPETYQKKRVRILNLKTGQMVPLETVPAKIRAEHKEALLKLAEQ